MTEYFIPFERGEAEYDEKRSRFLGYVCPIESEEAARAFIASIKKENYDARHNCWCYIIRNGPERYSDDGEPQGTAGIPMLEVFRKAGVVNVVCVVTRYFGGVLLGAGGLLRAYTRAASDALENAGLAVVRRMLYFRIDCSYSMAEKLKSYISGIGLKIDNIQYGASVSIRVITPESMEESFPLMITDYSSGTAQVVSDGEFYGSVKVGE